MSGTIDSSLIQQLNESDRKTVLEYIQQESSKAKIQTSVTSFTDRCFKKCITRDITSGNLDADEEHCMTDCLNQFLDTNIKVVSILQSMQK